MHNFTWVSITMTNLIPRICPDRRQTEERALFYISLSANTRGIKLKLTIVIYFFICTSYHLALIAKKYETRETAGG